MSTILGMILSMSVTGSVLIGILLLIDRAAGPKMSQQWKYYIWLLVVARLLVPFGPEAYTVQQNSRQTAGLDGSAGPLAEIAHEIEQIAPEAGESAQSNAAFRAQQTNGTARPSNADGWQVLVTCLAAVWAAGCLVLVVRRITAYQSFQKYVRAGMRPCTDPELCRTLRRTAEECSVRRPIGLAVNPLITSPMLIGMRRPCIVLPGDKISDAEFRFIVLHELTHLKRLDIVYKWAVQVAVCVHWFNPLVHLMSRRTSRACELSCDEAVLRRSGPDSAVPYGMTLLNAMVGGSYSSGPAGPVQLNENKRALKERLQAMRTYGQKRKRLAVVLSVFLAVCLTTLTACSSVYRGPAQRVHSEEAAWMERMDTVQLGPVPETGVLAIDADGCGIRIMADETESISVRYNPDCNTVSMSDGTVRLRGRSTWPWDHDSAAFLIDLRVPADSADSIVLDVRGCYLLWSPVTEASVTGTVSGAMTDLLFPAGYSARFSVEFPGGLTAVQSEDAFETTTLDVTADVVSGTAYVDAAHRTNGRHGDISITSPGGVVSVGGSEALTGDLADGILSGESADELADRIEAEAEGFAERIANGAAAFAVGIADAISGESGLHVPAAPEAPVYPRPPAAPEAPEYPSGASEEDSTALPASSGTAAPGADLSDAGSGDAQRTVQDDFSGVRQGVRKLVGSVLATVADALHTAADEVRQP